MVKRFFPLLFSMLMACNSYDGSADAGPDTTTIANSMQTDPSADSLRNDKVSGKSYGNQRFRAVRAERVNDSTFRVTGEGQIFEATFGWVIEDGYHELAEGYESTSAGAPAWGDFSFLVTAPKQQRHSTLRLVLFESSAKDGSRQHQLPIPLY